MVVVVLGWWGVGGGGEWSRWCEGKNFQERFDSQAFELADEAFERLIELREPEGEQVTDVVLKRRQFVYQGSVEKRPNFQLLSR